jgi:benzodiazapine receptor
LEPKEPKQTHPAISLLCILTVCFGVGFLASQVALEGLAWWYPTLQQPILAPPQWSFAPVWAAFYGLMGWAAWLVWKAPPSAARGFALVTFGVQLLLNGLWPWIFFSLHKLPLAFFESLVLMLAITLAILAFSKVSRTAAWLLFPYLVWICLTALLSYSIWKLNPNEGIPKTAIPPTQARPGR